jgi:hypothetical protein
LPSVDHDRAQHFFAWTSTWILLLSNIKDRFTFLSLVVVPNLCLLLTTIERGASLCGRSPHVFSYSQTSEIAPPSRHLLWDLLDIFPLVRLAADNTFIPHLGFFRAREKLATNFTYLFPGSVPYGFLLTTTGRWDVYTYLSYFQSIGYHLAFPVTC